MAGVARTHIHHRFAWQAWHLWHWWRAWSGFVACDAAALCVQAWHKLTSTVLLRGRRGTHGTGWRAWSGFVARDAAALCVAGVALGDIHLRFTWQMWHKLTSTFVLRGRRGTYGTQWRAWTGLVARDARDAAALCVAGVAQSHIHLRFTWQARHNLTSTFVLRGRRGTHGTQWRAWTGLVARDASDAAALCVAGMAQSHIHLRFTWQAWHNLTSTVVLRGRRGTHGTGWRAWSGFVACDAAAVCVAGVAQSHIHLRFTWQAWHNLTSTFVFAWQAWHLATSTFVLSHTIFTSFTHQLCHTPSFTTPSFTHIFVAHHLPHTILHTPCLTPSFTTPSFTHHFVTHHLSPHHLSHTSLSHTIFHHTIFHTPTLSHTIFHTHLCRTPSFATPSFTHHFVTHHLSHTTLSHALFHTQLSHTPSFTHNVVTHTIHTIFYIQLCHIHTLCFTSRSSPHLLCLSFLPRPRYNIWSIRCLL